MILVTAVCLAVITAVSVYMILGRDLKGVAMGVFLISHAANLSILCMSGSPVTHDPELGYVMKQPPLLLGDAAHTDHGEAPGHALGETTVPVATTATRTDNQLDRMVDPLPQALILTAIVISFAIMGLLLALIVVTGRTTGTLNVDVLAREQLPTPSANH